MRIENSAGRATYIENVEAKYWWHTDDAIMIRAFKSPHHISVGMGVGPEDLLTAFRFWPQPEGDNLLGTPSEPQSVEVRGRPGWEVVFAPSRSGAIPVTYVIDAELGVALARRQGQDWMELSVPALDEDFDDGLFEWSGAVRDQEEQISLQQREYEDKQRLLADMPRSEPTWLPSTITTSVEEGDPQTGTMELTATLQHSQVRVRRWLTALGEPAETFTTNFYPNAQRGQQGPWTIEIRTQQELATKDGQRILDSITPVPPPAQSADEIRADLERQRIATQEAEETAALGTGRNLRDYLGPNKYASLLIRTDFTDDDLWRETALAAMAPVSSGFEDGTEFQAGLTCIDNPDNDGLTVPRLLELIGSGPPYYAFLADHETIVNPEHPIVAVDSGPANTGHVRGQTIRVIPEEMWSIENNLSISNMGFDDFVRTTDADGVYRGIPKPEPPAHILTTAELITAVAQNTSTEALARLHQTVQELDANRTWPLGRTDFALHHKHVSESDYSGAETLLGCEDYLAATADEGSALGLVISQPRGYWQILFDENTIRPIAAMLMVMPAPPARQG